jgi:EAL domain-containing protein (putative c-di-GMP-specific phosphodiesterase class I)
LRQPDYLATVLAALRDSSMQAAELQVEITESVLAHGAEIHDMLSKLAALGVRLALDDFGTGYSSLSYVHSYPFRSIKIDRAFVSGLPDNAVSCKLAESIIVMCTALGKSVVAEGVETEAQREFLRRAGCTTIQGYLVARPMEAAQIPEFVARLGLPLRAATAGEEPALRQSA